MTLDGESMTEPPDFIKLIDEWAEQNKPPTLYELIWEEVGKKVGYGIDCDVMTDRIVDIVASWIPPSHKTNTYDWERCLKLMREKLR